MYITILVGFYFFIFFFWITMYTQITHTHLLFEHLILYPRAALRQVPSAFRNALWLLAPPKKLEPGQHDLLHEAEVG